MTIHEEIRRYRVFGTPTGTAHGDEAADAAEMAVYETARALGYVSTRAARIAAQYGRSLNL